MINIKQQLQQFSALVIDLNKLTKQMSALLSEESDNLKSSSPEALSDLTEKKKQIAQSLNIKTHQLNHFLASNGFKEGKEGINNWLKKLPASHPARSEWLELRAITETCAKQNEINGATVRVMQQHARRSLDILRGRHQSDTFYGADGYSKRENNSSSILTA
jgi:flagella synthesis protein FlgN